MKIKIIQFKIILTLGSIFLSSLIYGQVSQTADSIIYYKENRVLAQIFNEPSYRFSDDYKEYRLYNTKGFYCLSLYRNSEGFLTHENNNPIFISPVDPTRDLIFISDTFNTSFINLLNSKDSDKFTEKYDSALRYFYHIPDYSLDLNIIQFLDSNVYNQIDKQNLTSDFNKDTLNNNEDQAQEVVFIFNTPNVPILTHRYEQFARAIKSNVNLSNSAKRRNNYKLYFRIAANSFGKIEELECISGISNRNKKQLREVMENLKAIRLTGRARDRMLYLKAVFYVEFE